MSFRPASPDSRRHCGGVALVIVLAFVVLLTGLIVAFFSRALSERQISDSSANETRVDVFAAGAVNTVLGDFRQEIAAGSTQVAMTPSVAGLTLFNPTGAAAAPCLAGTALADGLPNLVKRSAFQQPFYSGSVYNLNAYPASNRAANSSTATAAQNGRAVSPARWNKALLLPKKTLTSETDLTPANSQGGYVPPDWIVVARDGTNPAAWSTALAVGATNPAVGRFAYNVYDEGGLLDANAAGFPTTTATAAPTSNSAAYLPAYKGSLAFADLKRLPGISSLPTSRQEQVVRTLLGWRNYASTGIDPTQASPSAGSPVSGSVNIPPGYQWTDPTTNPPGTGTNAFNFLNFAQINGNGFLRTANPLLVNGQSDRLFGSRQQLLALLLQSVADQSATTAASTERASLQNAMQYLGTFSRSLSQPSYVPPPGRPTVLSQTSGGNAEGYQNDDTVNPAFLKWRVLTGKTAVRNDGTDLVVGEPLVKKRFPLSRLAWLTYKGPSQGRTGADIDDLKTNFGYTPAFLDQGTVENIKRSFGLTWNAGYWSYNVHVGATGIMTLKEVQADAPLREPNFVELLKAAVTAGALGRAGTQSNSGPTGVQYLRDSSIDCQVIQLMANIIDQFDVDGFPTRIQFPAYAREFRGVENLPYFYRVRNGLYRLDNPVPMPSDSNQDFYPATTLTKSGAFIMVQQPEIWNPHAYDATSTATMNRSLGNPRPQNLQLVVYGAGPQMPPNKPDTGLTIGFNNVRCWWEEGNGGDGGSSGPSNTRLNATYTPMTFVNGASLYREPTLLIKPGIPANSNLQAPGFVAALQADGLSTYTAAGGVQVLDSPAMAYGTSEPLPGVYCGIYLGKNVVGYPYPTNNPTGTRVAGQARISGGPTWLTYQVQCDSATGTGMDVYDEKYFGIDPYTDDLHVYGSVFGMLTTSGAGQNSYPGRHILGLNRMMTFMDPRTSRFGVIASNTGDNVNFQSREFAVPGLKSPSSPRWVDQANNVVSSNRPDNSAGFGMTGGPPTSAGWTYSNTPSSNTLFRLGLFSQNNMAISNDDRRFVGDTDGNNMGVGTAQYYADADGVVRRAAGAYVKAGTAPTLSGNTTTGLPMATAYYAPANGDTRQKESRPIILNRPFRSVGELGCVFSDTPWKNIDFSTAESGYASLLDVFCVNDTDDPAGLVAGKVDLNTRQTPVLQAVLSGAYKDENNGASRPLSATEAQTLANKLYTRTTNTASGQGPLTSLADVVGGWKSGSGTSAVYDGYSADLDDPDPARPASTNPDFYNNNIPRYRESAVRALSAVGNTRVWNLMIDLVAQTGRYPQTASSLDKFVVEGEQRYWVHVAIDRYTGQVIDKQIEVVKE